VEPAAGASPWTDPAWQARALAWIENELSWHGITVSGPVRPRVRPWSVILRVPTAAGPVWFKANPPGSGFEPGLMAALARWVPAHVVAPLAVDADRRWSLAPDGGGTLRDLLDTDPDVRHWEKPLRQYACVQRDLARHVEDMLGLGLPDLRPAVLPDRFDELLADPRIRPLLDPAPSAGNGNGTGSRAGTGAGAGAAVGVGVDAGTATALRRLRPRLAGWCEVLAAAGVPSSLDHADLHDGHVFVAGERHAYYDWGDASVGHPFASLLVALRIAAERFGLAPGSAELARLRDAYLEPWTDLADPARLRAAVPVALRIAAVGRALSWLRVYEDAGAQVQQEHGQIAARWLARLLEPTLI
jgi:hypothetical protein